MMHGAPQPVVDGVLERCGGCCVAVCGQTAPARRGRCWEAL